MTTPVLKRLTPEMIGKINEFRKQRGLPPLSNAPTKITQPSKLAPAPSPVPKKSVGVTLSPEIEAKIQAAKKPSPPQAAPARMIAMRRFGRGFIPNSAINLTPEQKAVANKKAEEDRLFFGGANGGEFLLPEIKPGSHPYVEKLREASFNGDWATLFAMRPWNKWTNGRRRIQLGKFRFEWVNGKPRYKPLSMQDYRNYFSGPWINIVGEFGGKCPQERIDTYTRDYYRDSMKNIRKHPPSSPYHIQRVYPSGIICRPKQKSWWVKNREKVVGAAAIVGAVFLGPAIAAKAKAIGAGGSAAGGASGISAATGIATGGAGASVGTAAAGAAKAVGAATVAKGAGVAVSGSKILSGAQKLAGYVNKGRSIHAIANGELPPPPISVGGSSFREWAMIVAKDEIEREAKERAMQLGQKYIQKKLTAKEEAQLRAEIEAMQRELEAITPRNLPPQPASELRPEIKTIQEKEVVKHDANEKLLQTLALIGIPAALILAG